MKLGCIFTIIQLNCSIVHDIEHFISKENNFMVYIYIYIYIYIDIDIDIDIDHISQKMTKFLPIRVH